MKKLASDRHVCYSSVARDVRSACRRAEAALDVEALVTAHAGLREHLVPALLKLYIDVEYTERAAQFYEKFSMRLNIAELLAWLWTVPQHQATWQRTGASAPCVPLLLAARHPDSARQSALYRQLDCPHIEHIVE